MIDRVNYLDEYSMVKDVSFKDRQRRCFSFYTKHANVDQVVFVIIIISPLQSTAGHSLL
jgi:hypothetical protein